jgi:hypothetical protein
MVVGVAAFARAFVPPFVFECLVRAMRAVGDVCLPACPQRQSSAPYVASFAGECGLIFSPACAAINHFISRITSAFWRFPVAFELLSQRLFCDTET